MRFVVTCLKDNGLRVLASKSKVFTSVTEAIKYASTVADIRSSTVVPVPTDAQHAAEFIFEYIVERHPALLQYCGIDEIKKEIRFELGGEDIMVVFAPGNEIASAFDKNDMLEFTNELERLVEG